MSKVFADTFYFLALLNRNDQAHEAALQAAQEGSTPLVTTAWVIVETGDAMSGLKLRGSFVRFLAALRDDPAIEVIAADMQLLDKGLALYASRPDKEWSVTDCISFIVMQDHGISDALTGEHHFAQAGFSVLFGQ